MYHRDNRWREARRQNNSWSEVSLLEFRIENADSLWFHPADEGVHKAFYGNLMDKERNHKFDSGAFKDAVGQAKTTMVVDGKVYPVLTVDDLRSALKTGQELWTGLPEDGRGGTCGLCGKEHQPHKRSSFERDNGSVSFTGGDFAIVRKDVLQKFATSLRKEYAENLEKYKTALAAWEPAEGSGRFLDLSATIKPVPPVDPAEVINHLSSSVEKTMAEFIIGNIKPPELAVALPLGYKCGCQERMRNACRATFVARESVLDALAYADRRIGAADDRNETADILANLGARRPPQHTVGAGPSDGRRFDNNRQNFRGGHNRDRREKKPHRDWRGADLEVDTADALDNAGYASLADALAAANNGTLEEQGIAHPGSIKFIKFALKRASEGRTIVGEASRSFSDKSQKPESGADRPGKKTHDKKHELTAPTPSKGERKSGRSGKSTSPSQLRPSQLRD